MKLSDRLLPVLAGATLLLAIVLFSPSPIEYPMAGLDSAWSQSLNQAVADGKLFGRDITFTFGPLAAVYTHEFHPATDTGMMLTGLLLGVAYGAG